MSSDRSYLKLAVLEIQDLLKSLAKGEQFDETLIKSFGDGLNTEAAENLRRQWTVGDFSELPNIEIRSASELNGANGGFSTYTNHIYLSKEFLQHNSYSPNAITSVLLEEIGHRCLCRCQSYLAGTQPIAVKQAIFFGWNGGTYLSVNDSIAAFNTSSDLLINVTGMNGTLAAGSLTANNYFAP